METEELDLILNGIYYINFQEIQLLENSILRNIILENEKISIKTKNMLINRFLIHFTESTRFIEDETNEKIEKKLKKILKKNKKLKFINNL